MARLKVFRTPIGFHDAYVAAPSRKAALAAWGTQANLFARGAAEEVTDPALTAAPLARPGEVIKVSRGGRDEQLAALPADTPRAAAKPKRSRPPKPPRDALDAAERALADAEARHAAERDALAAEEAALERRRRALKQAQERETAALDRAREAAAQEYQEALARWRA